MNEAEKEKELLLKSLGNFVDYSEWSQLKSGDRVKNFTFGKGVITSSVEVGYVVRFDNGKTIKITDGSLKKCS